MTMNFDNQMKTTPLIQFALVFVAVSGASSKVKACSFDRDTCDWHNLPFDDDMDFAVSSSTSGGPSSGAGGSGEQCLPLTLDVGRYGRMGME